MNDTCKWGKNGFALEDYWETGCENLFQFINGGPEQNHFEFCPYCGKPIEEEKGKTE